MSFNTNIDIKESLSTEKCSLFPPEGTAALLGGSPLPSFFIVDPHLLICPQGEREIEEKMGELEKHQSRILERLREKEERMMRQLRELHRRIDGEMETRMKELKEKQEEMLE
jgi:hypothetical protein